MAVCGNRIKNRNLRSRRSGAGRAADWKGVGLAMSTTIRVSVDDKVGTIELDNFAKRNALGAATVRGDAAVRCASSSARGCGRSS